MTLLGSEVLSPAGLGHTTADRPELEGPGIAHFYEPAAFGRVKPARTVDNGCKFGAGGLLSTPADVASFAGAFMEGRLLPEDAVKEMLQPTVTTDGTTQSYGLGWGIATDSILGKLAIHTGSAIGGTAYLLAAPDYDLAVALATNIETERLSEALAVARLFVRP
jgi:CubicO group peptidase (beta-lactamase class C family)